MTLVIGYGSDLRGDDAVGRLLADRVRAWDLPGVRVLSVHQLTPDLAAGLAAVGRVLFLDAHPASSGPSLRIRRLVPAVSTAPLGHAANPDALLAWAHLAYGAAPDGWWITIPAERFDLGAPLSPTTSGAIPDALQAIRRLLDEPVPAAAVRGATVEDEPAHPPPNREPGTSNREPRTVHRA